MITAYIKNVREDGKLDLLVNGAHDGRVENLADKILGRLKEEPDGFLPLGDSSSPEAIRETFSCSKKDFKKAIGLLYKKKSIVITPGGISMAK